MRVFNIACILALITLHNMKDPNCYDWSFYFQNVAELLEERDEAVALEERLRKKIVAITPCDITQDKCITEGYEGPYDIVFSSLP